MFMTEHILKQRFCSISIKTSYSGFTWSPHRFIFFLIACIPNPQHCVPSWCMVVLIPHHLHCPKGIQLFWQITNRNTAFHVTGVFDPPVALKIKTKFLDDSENWLGASGANQVLIWHTTSCLNHAEIGQPHSIPSNAKQQPSKAK